MPGIRLPERDREHGGFLFEVPPLSFSDRAGLLSRKESTQRFDIGGYDREQLDQPPSPGVGNEFQGGCGIENVPDSVFLDTIGGTLDQRVPHLFRAQPGIGGAKQGDDS